MESVELLTVQLGNDSLYGFSVQVMVIVAGDL